MASFVLRVISLLAILGMAMPAHADTSFVAGTSCNEMDVGTTHIASNNMDILACLLNTSGKKVWKAMTSDGGPTGSMCGLVMLRGGNCRSSYPYMYACPPDWTQGYSTAINTPCGSTYINSTGQLTCPTGYTLRLISSGVTVLSIPGVGQTEDDPHRYIQLPPNFSYYNNFELSGGGSWSTWTCVKD